MVEGEAVPLDSIRQPEKQNGALHPDTLRPMTPDGEQPRRQPNGILEEFPVIAGAGKAVLNVFQNITQHPYTDKSILAERTATYTATSLKEAATVTKSFSSGDLVEVVTKTKEQVVDFSKRTSEQTNETTTALVDYSKRVWKISNWWRSPPQAVGRSSKPKLLIVYSDTGGGHKASATAICAAFEHLVPGQIEVKAVDVIEQYSLWPSNRTYSFFTSYPWLWSTIYKTTKQTHNLAPLLNAGVKSPANGATAADSTVVAAVAGASETQREGDDDGTGNAVMAQVHMKKKLSTQLAEAAVQYTDTPKSTMVEHLLDPAASLEPFILEGFIRCIQEERPDMIMSVHPILQSSERATSSHLKNGRKIPFVTVVTDLGEAHPWWFNKRVDRLFVPTQVMKDQGMSVGIDAERIHVCGLPLRQMFWRVDCSAARKRALRVALGVDCERPVVLLMGGGDGMGKLKASAMSFIDLLKGGDAAVVGRRRRGGGGSRVEEEVVAAATNAMQVVIVCGKNEALQRELQHSVAKAMAAAADSEVSVKVLGFVTNVDEWMVAADVLVTKAGPGTIAEACCCKLPMLLFDYLPGQEEGNVTFVTDLGMGEFEPEPANVAMRCLSWLRNPTKLAEFGAAVQRHAIATGAIDIARHTLELLQEEAHLNEEEHAADQWRSEQGAGPSSTLSGNAGVPEAAEDAAEQVPGDFADKHGSDGQRYKYVYQTAWWSWLSPFNHERAPSWWREKRVPVTAADTVAEQ